MSGEGAEVSSDDLLSLLQTMKSGFIRGLSLDHSSLMHSCFLAKLLHQLVLW